MSSTTSESDARELLMLAANVLSKLGLVQGHGHLSTRLAGVDGEPVVLSTPRAAPSLAAAEEMIRFRIEDREAYARALPVEAIMHTTVYEARADVGAIVRVHSPLLDAVSARYTELPIVNGRGSYLRAAPRVLDNPAPVSSAALALEVAQLLSDRQAVLLRGNGAVAVGRDLQDAVVNASYLLETVTIHLAGGSADPARPFTAEEVALRGSAMQGDSNRRTWEYLVSVSDT